MGHVENLSKKRSLQATEAALATRESCASIQIKQASMLDPQDLLRTDHSGGSDSGTFFQRIGTPVSVNPSVSGLAIGWAGSDGVS